MQSSCFSITLPVRRQQMGSSGLFVLDNKTHRNTQKKSDVIVQEMSASRVKISSAFTAYSVIQFMSYFKVI